jgi:hypothetical protein
MAIPEIAPLPPGLDLPAGWLIRVRAVDPGTGNEVSGVTVSNFSLVVDDLTGGGGSGLQIGPYMLVPGPGA